MMATISVRLRVIYVVIFSNNLVSTAVSKSRVLARGRFLCLGVWRDILLNLESDLDLTLSDVIFL